MTESDKQNAHHPKQVGDATNQSTLALFWRDFIGRNGKERKTLKAGILVVRSEETTISK